MNMFWDTVQRQETGNLKTMNSGHVFGQKSTLHGKVGKCQHLSLICVCGLIQRGLSAGATASSFANKKPMESKTCGFIIMSGRANWRFKSSEKLGQLVLLLHQQRPAWQHMSQHAAQPAVQHATRATICVSTHDNTLLGRSRHG